MPDPILLYSTNTWLSYKIAGKYYRDVHYVWCTFPFDSKSLPAVDVVTPPTSNPYEIYHSLLGEVRQGDEHSSKIEANKVGILKGATYKKKAGIINDQQEKDIASIVDRAKFRDFRPVLYVIPFHLVANILTEVPISQRAAPLSVEYIIEQLPREFFDMIEIERI